MRWTVRCDCSSRSARGRRRPRLQPAGAGVDPAGRWRGDPSAGWHRHQGSAHRDRRRRAGAMVHRPLMASDARLRLRYIDLWRASRGEQVVVRRLAADRHGAGPGARCARACLVAVRRQEGRSAREGARVPVIEELLVHGGRLDLKDAQLDSLVEAQFSLLETIGRTRQRPQSAADKPESTADGDAGRTADRCHRSLSCLADQAAGQLVGCARLGRATARCRSRSKAASGTPSCVSTASMRGVSSSGRSEWQLFPVGPLAGRGRRCDRRDLADHAGLHGPGSLDKHGEVWSTKVDDGTHRPEPADCGAALRRRRETSRCSRGGSADRDCCCRTSVRPSVRRRRSTWPNPVKRVSTAPPGRVLPAREFDLPSLRAMDANILLAFDELDLGTGRLEPLAPMRAHLVLQDAVLTIKDIDARTASGSLAGMLSLDGRKPVAMWQSDLRWQEYPARKVAEPRSVTATTPAVYHGASGWPVTAGWSGQVDRPDPGQPEWHDAGTGARRQRLASDDRRRRPRYRAGAGGLDQGRRTAADELRAGRAEGRQGFDETRR